MVKCCLRKTVGRSTFTVEELTTVIVEIESTLNNGPLTILYDDEQGMSRALTPADLIYGHRLAITPSSRQFEIDNTSQSLTRRARYQYQLLKNFIRQWQRDYLLSLRERAINHGSQKNSMIKEGDIVVLKEDCTARCLWKLAKIVELITGRDGRTRAAKVQLLSKDKVTTIRRPVQHLVPLEVN